MGCLETGDGVCNTCVCVQQTSNCMTLCVQNKYISTLHTHCTHNTIHSSNPPAPFSVHTFISSHLYTHSFPHRYIVLNELGGLYLDLDVECWRASDPFLQGSQFVVQVCGVLGCGMLGMGWCSRNGVVYGMHHVCTVSCMCVFVCMYLYACVYQKIMCVMPQPHSPPPFTGPRHTRAPCQWHDRQHPQTPHLDTCHGKTNRQRPTPLVFHGRGRPQGPPRHGAPFV